MAQLKTNLFRNMHYETSLTQGPYIRQGHKIRYTNNLFKLWQQIINGFIYIGHFAVCISFSHTSVYAR